MSKKFKKYYLVRDHYLRTSSNKPLFSLQVNYGKNLKVFNSYKGDTEHHNYNLEKAKEDQLRQNDWISRNAESVGSKVTSSPTYVNVPPQREAGWPVPPPPSGTQVTNSEGRSPQAFSHEAVQEEVLDRQRMDNDTNASIQNESRLQESRANSNILQSTNNNNISNNNNNNSSVASVGLPAVNERTPPAQPQLQPQQLQSQNNNESTGNLDVPMKTMLHDSSRNRYENQVQGLNDRVDELENIADLQQNLMYDKQRAINVLADRNKQLENQLTPDLSKMEYLLNVQKQLQNDIPANRVPVPAIAAPLQPLPLQPSLPAPALPDFSTAEVMRNNIAPRMLLAPTDSVNVTQSPSKDITMNSESSSNADVLKKQMDLAYDKLPRNTSPAVRTQSLPLNDSLTNSSLPYPGSFTGPLNDDSRLVNNTEQSETVRLATPQKQITPPKQNTPLRPVQKSDVKNLISYWKEQSANRTQPAILPDTPRPPPPKTPENKVSADTSVMSLNQTSKLSSPQFTKRQSTPNKNDDYELESLNMSTILPPSDADVTMTQEPEKPRRVPTNSILQPARFNPVVTANNNQSTLSNSTLGQTVINPYDNNTTLRLTDTRPKQVFDEDETLDSTLSETVVVNPDDNNTTLVNPNDNNTTLPITDAIQRPMQIPNAEETINLTDATNTVDRALQTVTKSAEVNKALQNEIKDLSELKNDITVVDKKREKILDSEIDRMKALAEFNKIKLNQFNKRSFEQATKNDKNSTEKRKEKRIAVHPTLLAKRAKWNPYTEMIGKKSPESKKQVSRKRRVTVSDTEEMPRHPRYKETRYVEDSNKPVGRDALDEIKSLYEKKRKK